MGALAGLAAGLSAMASAFGGGRSAGEGPPSGPALAPQPTYALSRGRTFPVAVASPAVLSVSPAGVRKQPWPSSWLDQCQRIGNHTAWNFQSGGTFVGQGGFAENEIAAASYTLPAADFPLRFRSAEMLFVTSNATVPTTTRWTLLVWQGRPDTGQLVLSVSSDGAVIPHLTMPPGTNGTVIQLVIDPNDPEQVIIHDDGTQTFSIGFRVDRHNSQTQNPCLTAPPSCCNAFPATDSDGLAQAANNWLYAINCGPFGCPPNGGWARFSQLTTLCRPSGDWVMRATVEPLNCAPASGACCLPDGSCQILTSAACTSQNGTYRGDNTTCATANCPQPTGACCFSNGNCLNRTQSSCASLGGTWLGAGTACNGTACPTGACCLPDGSCQILTSAACTSQNGTYRGDNTTCATANCPQPTGACCVPGGGCDLLTQAECALIPGAVWLGAGTACAQCATAGCYPNCDGSTAAPVLNVADFTCFLQRFAAGQAYANCDGSTTAPVLNVADFTCFLQRFAQGCP